MDMHIITWYNFFMNNDMNISKSKQKGNIFIALVFIMIMAITAVSFFMSIGHRSEVSVSQLKRQQAINCAEAALFEAFNRIRANPALAPWRDDPGWNNTDIYIAVNDPSNPGTLYNVKVEVTFSETAPYKASAKVNYNQIKM